MPKTRRSSWTRPDRWRAVLALGLLLAGCAGPVTPAQPPVIRPPFEPTHLVSVLVAGDASTRTFGHAVDHLGDQLAAAGVPPAGIVRLSAAGRGDAGAAPVALGDLLSAVRALHPAADGGCFVYLTSHGEEDGGVTIGDGPALQPEALDQALGAGCGDAPSVVVVSACRSGRFAEPPMARPNRVILTASRADRDSFDCGAGSVFTFFDECLLAALPGAVDWESVDERARGCIEVRERHVGVLPSEPQAAFGDQVRHLATPWSGSSDRAVVFDAGPESYSIARPPFRRAEGQIAAQLKSYERSRRPKAMAILPDGLVVWMNAATAGTDQPDALARLVLERCELIAGGACVLYARDDRVVRLLPSGLPPFHPPLLVRTGPYDPDFVPFVPPSRAGLAERYRDLPSPKALALSPARGAIGIATGPTQGAARAEALAHCGRDASDCLIYAEGDEIVLGWGG